MKVDKMKTCTQCLNDKNDDQFTGRYKICKDCRALNIKRERSNYTADNIKVLKQSEVQDRFDNWASTAHQLAHDYKKPIEFIERGLEACRRSHVSESYFVNRYLKEDKTIEQNLLVAEAYKDLMKEQNVYGAYTV
jgi:hypothetical protein